MEIEGGKKKKANAFFTFLLEYRRKEKNGNDMDMMELQVKAGEIWSVSKRIC